MPVPRLLVISDGRLLVADGDGRFAEHVSDFARENEELSERQRRATAWKSAPGQAGMVQRSMLWGGQANEAPMRPRFTHVVPGVGQEAFYVLRLSRSSGLFRYDFAARAEQRLFHKEEFVPHGLCRDGNGLIAAIRNADGSASLWSLDREGRSRARLSEGDVIDSEPSVSRADPQVVAYESTGIGRDSAGKLAGFGPVAAMALDRAKGTVRALRESAYFDYLQPTIDARGDLWCIKRPHRGPQRGAGALALDFIAFPFRLARALFAFLDVFSRMFAKRPLRTSGGPPGEDLDARPLVIRGMVVEAQRQRSEQEPSPLVPATWQLVRLGADGVEEVRARHVCAYWLDDNGRTWWSDGRSVCDLAGGAPIRLERGCLVEQLAAMPTG